MIWRVSKITSCYLLKLMMKMMMNIKLRKTLLKKDFYMVQQLKKKKNSVIFDFKKNAVVKKLFQLIILYVIFLDALIFSNYFVKILEFNMKIY